MKEDQRATTIRGFVTREVCYASLDKEREREREGDSVVAEKFSRKVVSRVRWIMGGGSSVSEPKVVSFVRFVPVNST